MAEGAGDAAMTRKKTFFQKHGYALFFSLALIALTGFVLMLDNITRSFEEETARGQLLQDAVARLNERERQIIRMRFYEGQTQMEVAREIGISQAQVSRLEKSALRSMRNYLSDER